MSIFASRTQHTIDLPFDPPQTVTIQKLPGRHYEKAQQENQFASVDALRRMGGATFQKELAEVGDKAKRDDLIAKMQADPLNGFDRYVLLAKGIVAWSYEWKVTPEAIEDLDDDAADFLAREILRLTKPSLFKAVDEAEADRKNG